MSFRNRPVLDRKHRPRWQDELRTQRLVVAGFATAIAVAIGIFGATAWSNHYSSHLRPVGEVNGVSFDIDRLAERAEVMGAELQAVYQDLQDHAGGLRDQVIQQQLSAIEQQFQPLTANAADSLVVGMVLDHESAARGISVTEAEVDALVAKRQTLPERAQLSVITIPARPADAAAGYVATDADWARAKTDAEAIVADLHDGGDFAAIAKERSHDASADVGGLLGWIAEQETAYADYFEEAHAEAVGTLLGPTKDASGYHVLHLDDHQDGGPFTTFTDLLKQANVNDAEYRAYIRDSLLRTAFTDYFSNKIMARWQPQREVAQIFIEQDQEAPVPKVRVRHFLAQPLPGEQDQSAATDEEWAAALTRAEAFRTEAMKPDADWTSLATTSDDTGTKNRGGELGWYDPKGTELVPEFTAAMAALDVGETSEPVKTQFGYHIIQVTGKRDSARGQASDLVTTLRDDPSRFAELAEQESEDTNTADKGGELGWVIRYQLDEPMNSAIFALTEPDQISEPIDAGTGYWIFKLLDTADVRWVPQDQFELVSSTGFDRWLQTLRDAAHVWVDAEFTSSATASTLGG